MPSRRTTTRGFLLLLLVGAFAGTSHAAVPRVTAFPVVGNVSFTNDYGAPRGSGWHQGVDIMARWRAQAVAFERGRVDLHVGSSIGTCMLYLHGRSGMTYVYIHLNNDLTSKSEDSGGCRRGVSWAPGLRDGEFVRRGELVGYVGDSGDAENRADHLHFEIRLNGTPRNPYKHLLVARRLLYPRPASTEPIWLRLRGRVSSIDDSTITVRTRRVLMSNGWKHYLRRSVAVTIPAGTIVMRRGSPATLRDAVPGELVTVTTTSFSPSWRTQRAPAGALSAATINLRG
jgi:hypothetical protein